MLDDFDPNKPCENYQERLKQYYSDIKKRMDSTKQPVTPVPPLKQPAFITKEEHKLPEPEPLAEDDLELLRTGKYPTKNVSMREMLPKLCEALGYDHEKVVGKGKENKVVIMRVNLIQLLYIMYGPEISLIRMAKVFNRDHSTILNLNKKYKIDKEAKEMVPIKSLPCKHNKRSRSPAQEAAFARARELRIAKIQERLGRTHE
jgi:hypothetical protein